MSDDTKPCYRCHRPTPVIRESGEPVVTVTTQHCAQCGYRAERYGTLRRDRPPTLAEVRTHEARGGDWICQPPADGEEVCSPEVWYIQATPDDEIFARHIGHCGAKCGRVYERLPRGRWWAWHNGPVAWPVV